MIVGCDNRHRKLGEDCLQTNELSSKCSKPFVCVYVKIKIVLKHLQRRPGQQRVLHVTKMPGIIRGGSLCHRKPLHVSQIGWLRSHTTAPNIGLLSTLKKCWRVIQRALGSDVSI